MTVEKRRDLRCGITRNCYLLVQQNRVDRVFLNRTCERKRLLVSGPGEVLQSE